MEFPVNLTNLRSMTDGDVELEKELFVEFFSSFEKGISTIKNSFDTNGISAWRSEVHSLKGIALNLGAEKLGEICKNAQDESNAGAEEKQKIFENIEVEYARVKKYLKENI